MSIAKENRQGSEELKAPDPMAFDVLHEMVSQLCLAYDRRARVATTRAEEIYWSAKSFGIEQMERDADITDRDQMMEIVQLISKEISALGGALSQGDGTVYGQ
ncbi:hypothetical protein GSS88_00040 [Corynebacterium sp. 3HC-13]|uniref:hypothetical protein n=1 Tax=Corynebacterium poyangense TaxID=2684405 RepID=UPI001CCBC1BC|nr:hypothetical protein [Corynebacterium poyangense]MBZ8176199.1 hypothetical protein [Corynebacterium poyangense]